MVYAELTLSRHRPTHLAVANSKPPQGTDTNTDGVVYAQIDHTKRKPKRRTDAPPPPQFQSSQQTIVVLPDVSQTMAAGNIRETTLMWKYIYKMRRAVTNQKERKEEEVKWDTPTVISESLRCTIISDQCVSIIVCFSSRLYAFLYTPQVYIYIHQIKTLVVDRVSCLHVYAPKWFRVPPPPPLSSSLCSGIDLVMEPFFSFLRNEHVWRRRWPRLRCYCHIWKGFFKKCPLFTHTVFSLLLFSLFSLRDMIGFPLYSPLCCPKCWYVSCPFWQKNILSKGRDPSSTTRIYLYCFMLNKRASIALNYFNTLVCVTRCVLDLVKWIYFNLLCIS